MDFINHTPFATELLRSTLAYRDLMLATVVAKCTFEVSAGGEVSVAGEQPPVQQADVPTPYGLLDGECVPIKQGCDFAIMGRAQAIPLNREVESLELNLKLGSLMRAWRVIGNRYWRKTSHGFEPSRPEPFREMVLGYDIAYGGKAIAQRRQKTGCYENPIGKGFVEREEDVEGLALPNFEDAEHLITHWKDRPLPAGLSPVSRHSSMRGTRGIRVDLEAGTTTLEPSSFCFSHPGMLLAAYPSGEPFTLTGMGPRGSLTFRVPEIELSIAVRLGEREHELSLIPDTLCVFPDHDCFHVLARRALVYQFLPERRRNITVRSGRPNFPLDYLTIKTASRGTAAAVPILCADESLAPVFEELLELDPINEMIEMFPLCASG